MSCNLELRPEKDQAFEFGFEYRKNERIEFSSVYFNRSEKNAIQLPDFVQYVNLEGSIRVKGIESQLQMSLMNKEKLHIGETGIRWTAWMLIPADWPGYKPRWRPAHLRRKPGGPYQTAAIAGGIDVA